MEKIPSFEQLILESYWVVIHNNFLHVLIIGDIKKNHLNYNHLENPLQRMTGL